MSRSSNSQRVALTSTSAAAASSVTGSSRDRQLTDAADHSSSCVPHSSTIADDISDGADSSLPTKGKKIADM